MFILIYLNWNNAVNNKYTKKYYLPKCIMENFNVCFNNFTKRTSCKCESVVKKQEFN